MQLKFAILEILAKRPEGRASIDELWREWEEAAENQGRADRFSDYEEIDFLQAGLVDLEEDSLSITETGRSVLRALETLSRQSVESGDVDQSQSLRAIDDLIGTEQRMKIFDLGLRAPGEIADFARLEEKQAVSPELTQTEAEADVDDDESEATAAPFADETAEVLDHGRPAEPDGPHVDLPNPPGFLKRASPSTIRTRSARRRSKFPAALSSQFRRFSHILRGHLAEGSSTIKTHGRPAGISGALLAVLSLVVILIGAGLFIGVNQIKTLKSEITALERQLVPLKKQAANVDQQEKRSGAEQLHKQPMSPGATETGKSPVDNRAAATALVLSPDDVRLIREYIKPAPFAGAAAPPINVGDPVTIATIPLPSPLTDKVPKLLGSRFTIRNGAIIILKRDSHQADAVLAPN